MCHNVTGVTVHGARMVRIVFEHSPEIHPLDRAPHNPLGNPLQRNKTTKTTQPDGHRIFFSCSWFWGLGEIAEDWWDLPTNQNYGLMSRVQPTPSLKELEQRCLMQ